MPYRLPLLLHPHLFIRVHSQLRDRVLGFKLDGQPAGLYLFAKWLIAAVLAVALIRYPRYSLHVVAAAVGYYG